MKMNTFSLALILILITSTVWAGTLTGNPACTKADIHIERSDQRALEVDFRLPGISSAPASYNGESFDLLYLEGEGNTGDIGAPELPTVTRLFAIPHQAGVRIVSFEPQYRTYHGITPYPHQEYEYGSPRNSDSWIFEDKYYGEGEFYPERWVEIGEPAIIRDLRLIPLTVFPVRVNPATGEARVLTGVRVELAFDETPSPNVKSRQFEGTVPSFNRIYRNMVSNYDYTNPNGVEAKGSFLIIYPNVSGVAGILQPYYEWKMRLGYRTEMIEVPNNASSTQVKNIIQDAYNNYDPPLEHVALVGDANGSVAIGCYIYNTGGTDHNYSLLEGDDILPEITVGRLSVGSTNDLRTVINKILYYEREPSLTTTDWYKSGALIAGSSASGLSTIQINRWIKLQLIELGFTEIDSMWYTMGSSSTIRTFMINEMNDGVSVFHFRGLQGMNGWSPSSILQVQNALKIPFATCLTCGTGSFNQGLAASEAFFRAGTPTIPKGAIGAVATSTTLTHTRYNNSMDMGMWAGLLEYGLTQAGPATFNGKLELYRTYQHDWATGHCFIYWNNLMGDPTSDIWLDVPQQNVVSHPDTLPVGTGEFTVTVTDSTGNPLPGRYINLWKGDETYTGGYTDEDGAITAPVSLTSSGELLVTVTCHNDYPYLGETIVVESPLNIGLNSLSVIDGGTPQTRGNNDSEANPSELIELALSLKNYGSSRTATGVSAVISTHDTSVSITSASSNFQDMAPGEVKTPDGQFIVQLGPTFRQGYRIPFAATITTNQAIFNARFDIRVSSGEAVVDSLTITGGYFNPGDTDNLVLFVHNTGEWDLNNVTGVISIADTMVTIIDEEAGFGNISAGQTVSNQSNPFVVAANSFITNGLSETFTLRLTSSNGQIQDLYFSLTAGTVDDDDPFGPDSYGYFCIDDADELYTFHPICDWTEISGIGTPLNLPDTGGDNDKSIVITLPFSFRFYGENHQALTVCSNGWMAFGSWALITEFRNQTIPCSFGPPSGMVIPYWDNLKTQGGNMGVYQYYDQPGHRFIIEYYNCPHTSSSSGTQTFQVIFYDQAYHPTRTGDGEIVFQYQTFHAVVGPSTDHAYWTTGIMNPGHTDGLEYAFWNRYHPGAAPLQSGIPTSSGRAVKFTTNIPIRGPRPLTIDIEPISPPIVIPPQGGSFRYTAFVADTGSYIIDFDAWVHATLPNGLQFGPLLVRVGNRIEPGMSFTRTVTQYIPGQAGPGNYLINAFLGDYNTREVWTTDSLPFSKSGSDPGFYGEWKTFGWDGEIPKAGIEPSLPLEFSLLPPSPNPFNPAAALCFRLPVASPVKIAVYDVNGREAALLTEGFFPAGSHQVEWNAAGNPSGVYFAIMNAGDFKQVRKLLLLK